MSPGPATMSFSPGPAISVAQGVSPPASAVNVKTQANDDRCSPDDDSRGHRISGDEAGSDDDDFVGEVSNRNGKRKRPISVSYVYSSQPAMWLMTHVLHGALPKIIPRTCIAFLFL